MHEILRMHDFKRLKVWRMARELAAEVCSAVAAVKHPTARMVASQLARAALSIAANIAEGCGKSSRRETVRYLEIAAGSAAETEHHLLVAAEMRLFEAERSDDWIARIGSIRRMLRALVLKLPDTGIGVGRTR